MAIEYRYGISFLNKLRHTEAKEQEVLLDKQTGEMTFKAEDGSFISYDYQNRINIALSNMERTSEKLLRRGVIKEVVLSKVFPMIINTGTNVVANDMVPITTKNLLVQLDVDVLNKANVFSKKVSSDNLMVRIDVTKVLKEGLGIPEQGSTVQYLSIDESNECIIKLDDSIDFTKYSYFISGIYITEKTMDRSRRRKNTSNRIILHNILIMDTI